MNRRTFLGLAAAAPLVAPQLAGALAKRSYPLTLADMAPFVATHFRLTALERQYIPHVWPVIVKTSEQIRELYPDSPAALPIEKRKSSRAFPPANSERDAG